MTGTSEAETVWQRLDELSDREIALLVEAAIAVLEGGGDEVPEVSAAQLPPAALRAELREALAEWSQEAPVVFDPEAVQRPEMAIPTARLILERLAREPALAAEIESAYEQRQGLLLGPEIVLAGALLLLVIKLRKVKVDKDGFEVELDPISKDTVQAVSAFLGRG